MENRTRGWFPLSKFDRLRIISEGGPSASSMLNVWVALLEFANNEGKTAIRMRKALIAHMTGLSYRWVGNCLQSLESLGMLRIERQGKHAQPDEPSLYNLLPTVNPIERDSGAGTVFTRGQEESARGGGNQKTDLVCPPVLTSEQDNGEREARVFPSISVIVEYGKSVGIQEDVCHDFFDHNNLQDWRYGKNHADISPPSKWPSALRKFNRHRPSDRKQEQKNTEQPWQIKANIKALEEELESKWSSNGFEHTENRERKAQAWTEYKALKARITEMRNRLVKELGGMA